MAKNNYFVDVAIYQPDDLAYFKKLKAWGARGCVVKLTEGSADGSAYVNARAAEQVKNAAAAGLMVSAYHYFLGYGTVDAQNEAKWFLKYLKAYGIPRKHPVVCDAEDPSLRPTKAGLTSDINAFLAVLKSAGYTNLYLYTGASFGNTRMNRGDINAHYWVASYPTMSGVTAPYTAYAPAGNYSAWQFTSNWHGISIDCSVDYGGAFTVAAKKTPEKPSYYTWNPRLIEARKEGVGVYHDPELKHLYKKVKAGKQYQTTGVVKSKGGAYRLKLKAPKNDYYVSARTDLWKNMYYMDNPKWVEVIGKHGIYIYPNATLKKSERKTWYGKGEVFGITSVERTPNGIPVLKTKSGFYITANKNYVRITE